MESEFPSNSKSNVQKPERASKPEEKKVTRVVQGDVIRRKKSFGKKFKDVFFGGDAKGSMTNVILDVAVPAFKDLLVDFGETVVRRMILGDSAMNHRHSSGYSSRSRQGGRNGFVNYQNQGRNDDSRDRISRKSRATHDFDEIILPTRVEAEETIDQLFELISKYDQVTVSELYEIVGVKDEYTDRRWGWTDLRGAGATRISNGYLLDLPKPELLD